MMCKACAEDDSEHVDGLRVIAEGSQVTGVDAERVEHRRGVQEGIDVDGGEYSGVLGDDRGRRLGWTRRRGAVLFVQGRAGFGKTRLLAEAAAMASQAGVRAGLGAVQASDQVVPMAGLITALFDGREPLVDPAVRHRLSAAASPGWSRRETAGQG
jgi:hypothetical protein